MNIIMIAAVSENNGIGKGNDLMWRLPDDFKRFKELTLNKNIIMGRKTFDSLPGILPKRNHIIITRDRELKIDGVKIVHNIKDSIDQNITEDQYIIGGSEIYNQFMNIADKLEITKVHHIFDEADSFFPEIDENKWLLIGEDFHEKDDKHQYSFTYQTWIRK